jgi:hypothetical protein
VCGDHLRMRRIDEGETRYLLQLSRDARTGADRTELARRAGRGELVRIVRGAYLPEATWRALDEVQKYRARIQAVAALSCEDLVFSHASAAALWGLPWLGPWPNRIEALSSRVAGGQSTSALRRHIPNGADEHVVIAGLRVTTLARTVVDIARSPGFTRAVVVGDAAINTRTQRALALPGRGLDIAALGSELASSRSAYGAVRAADVLGFLDGGAGSPAESISRVSMLRAGIPAPILQQPFPHPGGIWYADFWWPDVRVIGECDGAAKYLDARLRDGRSPEQIVYEEKLREDALRRRSSGFARWDYAVAMSPSRLARRLREAGVPARRH